MAHAAAERAAAEARTLALLSSGLNACSALEVFLLAAVMLRADVVKLFDHELRRQAGERAGAGPPRSLCPGLVHGVCACGAHACMCAHRCAVRMSSWCRTAWA